MLHLGSFPEKTIGNSGNFSDFILFIPAYVLKSKKSKSILRQWHIGLGAFHALRPEALRRAVSFPVGVDIS